MKKARVQIRAKIQKENLISVANFQLRAKISRKKTSHPESNFCAKIPPQSKPAPQSTHFQKAIEKAKALSTEPGAKVQAIGLVIDLALGRKEKGS